MADRSQLVEDTYAEAFRSIYAEFLITARDRKWLDHAVNAATGNASSSILCDCEAGLSRYVGPGGDESFATPDGRPGAIVQVHVPRFKKDREAHLEKVLLTRISQNVLTCPTTACFNGICDCPKEKRIRIGGAIRYFGDGFQKSKKLGDRRYWRIPVMDGEFLCEDWFGTQTGIAGGNLLFCGRGAAVTLQATEAAVDAIRALTDVALPFPGGIVRSGSKVGSRYPKLKASTNDAYCPTLRGTTASELPPECQAVYEIVIDGLSFPAVQAAMKAGLHAAAAQPGLLRITAGNYGGKLGKHHFSLKDLL